MRKLAIAVVIAVLCLVVLYMRLGSVVQSATTFSASIATIVEHPYASYDEKMTLAYPRFYPYIQMVKANTPENSDIRLPPKPGIPYGEPMWSIAHAQLLNALLYPRLIEEYEEGNIQKTGDRPTYVMIVDGYPNYRVAATRVIIFDGGGAKVSPGPFDPTDFPAVKLGLIQL